MTHAFALFASQGSIAADLSAVGNEDKKNLKNYTVNAVSNNAVKNALKDQDAAVHFTLENNAVSLIYASNTQGNFVFEGNGTETLQVESVGGGLKVNNGKTLALTNLESLEIAAGTQGANTASMAAVLVENGTAQIQADNIALTSSNCNGLGTVNNKSKLSMSGRNLNVVKSIGETSSVYSENTGSAIQTDGSSAVTNLDFDSISLSANSINNIGVVRGNNASLTNISAQTLDILGTNKSDGIEAINGAAVNVNADETTIRAVGYGVDSHNSKSAINIGTAGENQSLHLISGVMIDDNFVAQSNNWTVRAYNSGSINIQTAYVDSNSGFLAKTLESEQESEVGAGGTIIVGSFDDNGQATTKDIRIVLSKTSTMHDGAVKAEGRGQISMIAENIELSNADGLAIRVAGKHGSGEAIEGNVAVNATKWLEINGDVQAENTGGTASNISYIGTYQIDINTDERAGGTVQINGNLITKNDNDSTVLINANLKTADSVLNGAILNTDGNAKSGTNLGLSNGAKWNVTADSQVKSISGNGGVINANDKTIAVDTVTTDDLTFKTSVVKEGQLNIGTLNTNQASAVGFADQKGAINVEYTANAVNGIDYSDLLTVAHKQVTVQTFNTTYVEPEKPALPETPTTPETSVGPDTSVEPSAPVLPEESKPSIPEDNNQTVVDNENDSGISNGDNIIDSIVTTPNTDKETSGSVNQVVVGEGAVDGVVTVGKDDNGNVLVNIQTNTAIQALSDVYGLNYLTFRSNINDLDKRLGDIRIMPKTTGLWARYYAGENKYGKSELQTNYRSVQMGVDTFINDNFYLGAAFGFKDADSTSARSKSSEKNYNFGIYGGWLGEKGQFVDLIVKRHRILTSFHATNTENLNYKGSYATWGNSVSLEGGWRFNCPSTGFYAEPSMELMAGSINGVSYKAANGVKVNQKHTKSLIGRVGVAAGYVFPKDKGSVYVKASALHDWKGKTQLTATDGNRTSTVTTKLGGTWGEFSAGGTYRVTNKLSAYGEVQTTAGSPTRNPWQFSVGMRYSF